jgi:O-antigen ligase
MVVDVLLLATVFSVTFAKLRWEIGSFDIHLFDFAALLFLVAFAVSRHERDDWGFPGTGRVLAVFFAAFALVYLVGFFNLDTTADRTLFAQAVVGFAIHFPFLFAAVAHLSRRSERFYWRTFAWFVAGVAVNALYGVFQLAAAVTAGTNLDRVLLAPIGSYQLDDIDVLGRIGDVDIYRTNALADTANHLGIVLLVPLVALLPLYLRLERGHRLRTPLAALLVFLLLVDLTTLSRSGFVGLAAGLVVLAVPYRHFVRSSRLLLPLAGAAALVALAVAQQADVFERVFLGRASLDSPARLVIWSELPAALEAHPVFGLGLNTFTSYFEFATGDSGQGPHSYYVALLSETGIAGTLLAFLYLAYLFRRLGALRSLGRRLARAGDIAAVRIRPLAWGLTAAFVGTLVANAFLMTIPLFYFFAFAALAFSAPLVFGRRRSAPA